MGRVGWATVIGCVLGVMLFGILQRGCDAEGTGGVEVLPMESTTQSESAPQSRGRSGLSVLPGPAPERAISGPTSPPRGTPRTMQVAAARDRAAREAGESASDDRIEWLREQREQALARRQAAREAAAAGVADPERARRLAQETAERLRRSNANQTNVPSPTVPNPAPAGAFADGDQFYVESYDAQVFYPPSGFQSLALPPASFSDFGTGDTTLEGVPGESTAAAGGSGDNLGDSGGGSITTRGTGGTPTGGNNGGGNNGGGNGGNNGGGNNGGGDNGGGGVVTLPAAPGLSAPPNSTQDALPTLTLSWSAAARATTYTVQVSTAADFATLAFSRTGLTTTSLALPAGSINPGASYFWRVLAVNAQGETPSSVRTFATLAAPRAFSVSAPANNAPSVRTPLTLSWSSSDGADAYSVIVASDAAFSNVVFTQGGLTGTSIAVPEGTLDEGAQYWWRVIATNAAGSALASPATATFTTLGPPGAFTLVSPANNAVDQFVPTPLAWTPARFAASYRVEVATDAAFQNRVVNRAGLIAPTTILTADEVEPGMTYFWRVTAVNDLDMVVSTQTFTFSTAPLPGEFSLTSPGNNASVGAPVTLRWTESERALLYVVQVATDQDFTDLVVDEFVIPLLTGETSYAIAEGVLDTGATYYWRIEAQNEVGAREAATPVYSFTIRSTDFDVNGDGVVDVRDLYAYHAASPTPDVNFDGQRNNDDRLALRNRIRQSERSDLSEGRSN